MPKRERGNKRKSALQARNQFVEDVSKLVTSTKKKALLEFRRAFLEIETPEGTTLFHHVINKIYELAMKGDVDCLKLIMSYTAGKPSDGEAGIHSASNKPNIIVYNAFEQKPKQVIEAEIKEQG